MYGGAKYVNKSKKNKSKAIKKNKTKKIGKKNLVDIFKKLNYNVKMESSPGSKSNNIIVISNSTDNKMDVVEDVKVSNSDKMDIVEDVNIRDSDKMDVVSDFINNGSTGKIIQEKTISQKEENSIKKTLEDAFVKNIRMGSSIFSKLSKNEKKDFAIKYNRGLNKKRVITLVILAHGQEINKPLNINNVLLLSYAGAIGSVSVFGITEESYFNPKKILLNIKKYIENYVYITDFMNSFRNLYIKSYKEFAKSYSNNLKLLREKITNKESIEENEEKIKEAEYYLDMGVDFSIEKNMAFSALVPLLNKLYKIEDIFVSENNKKHDYADIHIVDLLEHTKNTDGTCKVVRYESNIKTMDDLYKIYVHKFGELKNEDNFNINSEGKIKQIQLSTLINIINKTFDDSSLQINLIDSSCRFLGDIKLTKELLKQYEPLNEKEIKKGKEFFKPINKI